MAVDQKLVEEWERRLITEGLGIESGHDPDILKYGFSVGQLEDLHADMQSLNSEAHKVAVTLNQQELRRQRNASRTNQRKKLRDEKARIREAIWGKSTT